MMKTATLDTVLIRGKIAQKRLSRTKTFREIKSVNSNNELIDYMGS